MEQSYKLFTSCLWQTTSAVVPTEERLYLFDPAYFPHEVEAIAHYVEQVRNGRELVVVLTHGDWDHIAGFQAFADATLVAHKEILVPGRLERSMEKVKRFDGSYYVPRPYSLAHPSLDRVVHAAEEWMGQYFLPVPGHKSDQMAVLFRKQKLMVVGDMLSNLEFPFVEDSGAYLDSLEKIERFVQEGTVEEIIPGHGLPARGSQEILTRIERDRRYLEESRLLIREGIAAGVDEAGLLEQFARMTYDGLPIGEYMRSAHEENGIKLIREAVSSEC